MNQPFLTVFKFITIQTFFIINLYNVKKKYKFPFATLSPFLTKQITGVLNEGIFLCCQLNVTWSSYSTTAINLQLLFSKMMPSNEACSFHPLWKQQLYKELQQKVEEKKAKKGGDGKSERGGGVNLSHSGVYNDLQLWLQIKKMEPFSFFYWADYLQSGGPGWM